MLKVGDKVTYKGVKGTVVTLRGSMHVDINLEQANQYGETLMCDVSINDEQLSAITHTAAFKIGDLVKLASFQKYTGVIVHQCDVRISGAVWFGVNFNGQVITATEHELIHAVSEFKEGDTVKETNFGHIGVIVAPGDDNDFVIRFDVDGKHAYAQLGADRLQHIGG